jgi:hypothetical protein
VNPTSDAPASMFGCNTYSYMRALSAEACLARLADQGFEEFEVMVHPGHLWPGDLSAGQRRALRGMIEQRKLRLVSLNMPNIDINVASAAPGMRAYSLQLLVDTVRLAGELGARGVVIGPGKANPLFPAGPEELTRHFFAALDVLCPVAQASGTALWVENMPFAFLPAIGDLLAALSTIFPTPISSARISPTACGNAAPGWNWSICRIRASRPTVTTRSASARFRSRKCRPRWLRWATMRSRCWKSSRRIPTATLLPAPANSRY